MRYVIDLNCLHRASILIGAFCFVFALSTYAFAQDEAARAVPTAAPPVTAAATAERVRFSAPNSVVQLRLEVYTETGQKLFDTEQRGGSVLDWHLTDGQGQRVADGAYLCVVTVKALSGRLSQKLAQVLVGAQTADVQPVAATQLSAAQAQAVGPLEADTALTILSTGAPAAATMLAHDSTDGQLTRTRGALRFTVGDFFAGLEREQMRLTEAGDLGLGTKKPQAKLDVAGDIRSSGFLRATKGIEFADGTVQTSGLSGRKDTEGNIVPAAAGAGTQNRLAKWTDNSGTLGDSVALDTGTGLQLTAPASPSVDTNVLFTIGNDRTAGIIASSTPAFLAANGPYFALRGNTYSAIAGQRGNFVISAGNVSSPGSLEGVVKFVTGNDQLRMLITPTGNVGVGTSTPQTKFDVRGHLVLDAGTDPILYTGTDNTELNRYLQLINSPSAPSASGLKAGGLLVADSFAFGNPGKNDLIVKGNMGLGLSNPASKLHLFGSANITGPFRGLTIDQTVNAGANTSGYAMSVMTTTGGVTSTNFLINSFGNTGVGTASPSQRLHVAQSGDYQLRLENPASGGGFWNIGQTDNSFSSGGSELIFVPNTTNSSSAAVVFTNAGRVGIGTTAPTGAKLDVEDSSIGTAVYGRSTLGSGVFGESTSASGWGVYGRGSAGYAVYAEGNAGQSRDKGGFVKAMVFVDVNGSILRCYNSLLTGSAATTAPCGFTTDHFTNGGYTVDFGFQVSDRFFSVSPQYCNGCFQGNKNTGVNFDFFTTTSMHFFTFQTNESDTIDRAFMVIVY